MLKMLQVTAVILSAFVLQATSTRHVAASNSRTRVIWTGHHIAEHVTSAVSNATLQFAGMTHAVCDATGRFAELTGRQFRGMCRQVSGAVTDAVMGVEEEEEGEDVTSMVFSLLQAAYVRVCPRPPMFMQKVGAYFLYFGKL